jgi:hypothetical protein
VLVDDLEHDNWRPVVTIDCQHQQFPVLVAVLSKQALKVSFILRVQPTATSAVRNNSEHAKS